MNSPTYLTVSALDWIMILCFVAMSAILQSCLSLILIMITKLTGAVVCSIYERRPRRLLVTDLSKNNFSIVVAEHLNPTEWIVFYGKSTIIISLFIRSLEPNRSNMSPDIGCNLGIILSILTLGAHGYGSIDSRLEHIFHLLLDRNLLLFAFPLGLPREVKQVTG